MGQTAQHISKVNRDELLDILNVAFSEEWLAYYQYWIGAGCQRSDAQNRC